MQVKKFEAKTMKEALEMVKTSLGPEAVILSARDTHGGFGLAGHKSVEVTAAVTEEMLRKKKLAERRLNRENHERFLRASAERQKHFIDKVFQQHKRDEYEKMRPITKTPYIEIDDDSNMEEASQLPSVSMDSLQEDSFASEMSHRDLSANPEVVSEKKESAEQRIRGAAKRAFSGASELLIEPKISMPPPAPPVQPETNTLEGSHELLALRKEIKHLKGVISKFNKVPQSFVSMHPGAEEGISYELSHVYQKLCRAGVNKFNVVSILKKLQEALPKEQIKKRGFVDAWIAKYIMDRIAIAENRTLSRYHAFFGPSGHGKTSSLVKIASHMVICEKKKVAIVTTDNRRVGAAEQLKIYAQILNVPFAMVRSARDWEIIDKKLSGMDAILVDFPGLNLRSMEEIDFIRGILPPFEHDRSVHFVQSVLARDEDAIEIASRYRAIGFDDVIFTNLDETVHHGIIFNFQQKFESPLHSFGIGPHIPEDLEPATKERVVDLIFKLTKLKKKEEPHG